MHVNYWYFEYSVQFVSKYDILRKEFLLNHYFLSSSLVNAIKLKCSRDLTDICFNYISYKLCISSVQLEFTEESD